MKARREALGLTVLEVDALAGFPEGYTSKLENWQTERHGRGCGKVSLDLWCQTLGVEIALLSAELPTVTARTLERIPRHILERRAKKIRKVSQAA